MFNYNHNNYDCILSSPLAPEQVFDDVSVLTNVQDSFLPKQQTTAAYMLSSQENEQVENNVIGKTSNSALEIAPAPSAPSLKRKPAAIVVSDDEDDLPVAGPSQNLNLESLTALGIKNMKKLKGTNQFPDGPNTKECQSCGVEMDWKTTGSIKGRKNKKGVLTHYTYHNACTGDCVKEAYSEKRAETLRTPGNEEKFLETTAENLRQRSPNFEKNNADDIEKSKDFIAILFSDGQVTAADVATSLAKRYALIEDIKNNQKFTAHTGLPALFHRSSTFDMASPDRTVFVHLEDTYLCPDYLDPRQITVLASHFSQRFFNATPHRSRLLNKLIGFYLNPVALKLEFESRFDFMDNRLELFLSCGTAEQRRAMTGKFPQTKDKEILKKIQKIFRNMKAGQQDSRIKKMKEMVCDFNSWEEVNDFFRIFEYRCVVSGIAWNEGFLLSLDKVVTTGSRYNWFDCLPMMWRLNQAKNAERKTFETRESLKAYMEANGMADLHPLQVLVKIMRVQFVALVSHSFALHGYGPQEPFDDSLKATPNHRS